MSCHLTLCGADSSGQTLGVPRQDITQVSTSVLSKPEQVSPCQGLGFYVNQPDSGAPPWGARRLVTEKVVDNSENVEVYTLSLKPGH